MSETTEPLKNAASLKNQVVLITGASQGIGRAIAHRLAAEGMTLMLAARSGDKLADLAQELRQAYPGLSVEVQVCDVRDAKQVAQVVQATLARHRHIDVLVNNAGVAAKIGLLQEVSVEEIDRTIDTNLKGPLYAIRAVLPSMVARQSWVIGNINSVAGKTAYPFWAVYDASKFGLYAVTEAVAEEQRSNGIKVVGIYPGPVDTEIWDAIDMAQVSNREGMLRPEDVAEAVLYVLRQPQQVFVSEMTLAPLKPAL